METIAKIRRLHHVQNKGIKTIARELGLSNNTVRKVLRSDATQHAYQRSIQPYKVLGAYKEALASKLSADKIEPVRRRRTAKKLYLEIRELGFETELENVDVYNLVPKALRDVSLNDFLQQLPNYNQQIMDSLTAIRGEKERLAYVGRIDQFGKITVGIQSYPQTHPFSRLNGTDNILLINTKHYHEQPLVIQGPGAGTDVTAAGIFTDLLRLNRQVPPKYIAIDA